MVGLLLGLGLCLGAGGGSTPVPPDGYAFVTTTDASGNRVYVTTTDAQGNRVYVVTRITA